MIRELFSKIFSIKNTPQGDILTFLGDEYILKKSVEPLLDRVLILETALEKRVQTIQIMDNRLKKNMALIERMHKALDAQNRQMHEQMDIINTQRRQLKHIDQIDWRMNKLKLEQKKLSRYNY
jgi:hypothetical protein